MVDAEVKLTATHKGYFQFRVGDFTNKTIEGEDSGKLKGYLLKVLNGNLDDKTKFKVPKIEGTYKIKLQLPSNLICERCVMQWWYTSDNGTGENYVNCADIQITK